MSELLKASDVCFAYGERAALRDVSLSLAGGELVAVIGPNGSGKSTLIRTLLAQHSAQGSIEWEGRSIRWWRRRELARRVAYLPQSPSADLEQTVEQTLRLGRAPYWRAFGIESEHDARVVAQVGETLALSDALHRPLAELSGGQRQRVFIGRCLVQEPLAMLLDEPSTYLDLRHQIELLRLLKQLVGERSIGVLMASHDVNLAAMFADRMLVLDAGRIVATGTPTEVMQSELLSRVYGVSLQVLTNGNSPVVVPVN